MRDWELFWSFFKVGLFSMGGGYAAVPLIRSQVVTGNRWLSMEEFMGLVSLAEMTPGPIAVNAATFVGIRTGGMCGAVAATFGCILPSCIFSVLLAYYYGRWREQPGIQKILLCLRAAAAALIAGAGLGILRNTALSSLSAGGWDVDWISVLLFLTAFAGLRIWKWNPVLVMTVCGTFYAGVKLFK